MSYTSVSLSQHSPQEMQSEMEELNAELRQCEKMRRAESSLAQRLADSQRQGANIENKAMNVARELVDSSQAIAWLQSEVAAQRDGWAELEEMNQQNLQLRQQLETSQLSLEKAKGAKERDGNKSFETEQGESEDRHKATVVSEALQVAWEGEAREHRQAQQKLQSLQTIPDNALADFAVLKPKLFWIGAWGIFFSRVALFTKNVLWWSSGFRSQVSHGNTTDSVCFFWGAAEWDFNSRSCLNPARQELLRLAELLLHEARSGGQSPSRGFSQVALLEDLARRLRDKLSIDAIQQLMTSVESFALELVESLRDLQPRRGLNQRPEAVKPRVSRSTPSRRPWDSDASPSPKRPDPIIPMERPQCQEPVARDFRDFRDLERVPGATGPLYRLDFKQAAQAAMESPARGRQRRLEHRRFDRLNLDLEERFDEYSVHRPRRKAT